jgi:hypothetical protein
VTADAAELAALVHTVHAEALALGRADLAVLLPDPAADPGAASRLPRIVVAGETKRGKSRLVNALLGRPDISPVGVDVTTSCWAEFRHGPADAATVLLADPEAPGTPKRVPIAVADIHSYVALGEVTDPVVGLEVTLDAPILRSLVLVDTPGVGGLHAGHSRTTLAALRQADALLFVCDASQPILAPEVAFLAEAARRIDTIAVAVGKSDVPDHDIVLAETRRRLAAHPDLAGLPVFAVSAALSERAGRPGTPAVATARLTELAGLRELVGRLLTEAAAGARRLRAANDARLTASVARALCAHLDQLGAAGRDRLRDDIDTVTVLLADRGRLRQQVDDQTDRVRAQSAQQFAAEAGSLAGQYRGEAERGPAAQLPTLAPRLIADLTAAGVAVLDETQRRTIEVLRESLRPVGGDAGADLLLPPPADLELSLRAPAPASLRTSFEAVPAVTRAIDLLPALTGILTGSSVVVSLLTGPGAIAAGIALAACAGWWRIRGESEQQRRAMLAAWVAGAVTEAEATFGTELSSRVLAARRHVGDLLPELLEARLLRLSRLRDDHDGHGPHGTARATLDRVLDDLTRYRRSTP